MQVLYSPPVYMRRAAEETPGEGSCLQNRGAIIPHKNPEVTKDGS